ncbi:MAG: glycine--tRNA ligase subunit beta, partial [Gammaproteobacteria bacterium]
MERRDFLLEIGTEELPPKALRRLSEALAAAMRSGLDKAALHYDEITPYASPRRLALLVTALDTVQAGGVQERRGPALAAAFDAHGAPTPAALGFARSCGVEVDHLETMKNDKGAWLMYRSRQPDRPVQALLPPLVGEALAALPIPKRMRWGSLQESFVRPVHWLVLLLGNEVVAAGFFGLAAGRETRGHRFHHPDSLCIDAPAAYASLLEREGRVMADFAARREAIRAQVKAAARQA